MMGWKSASTTNYTYAEYEINGRYCKSGLAFPTGKTSGNCTATDRIVYLGKNLTKPYSCDPINQANVCQLYYNASAPNDAIQL